MKYLFLFGWPLFVLGYGLLLKAKRRPTFEIFVIPLAMSYFFWLFYYCQLTIFAILPVVGVLLGHVLWMFGPTKKRAISLLILNFLIFLSLFWLRLDQICVQSVLAQNQTLTRLSIALGADVNGRDSYGGFPLLFATVWNNRSLVEYLVASGADPYQNAEGQTLLDYACQICSVDLVAYYQSLGVSRTKMLVPSDCPICESEADP